MKKHRKEENKHEKKNKRNYTRINGIKKKKYRKEERKHEKKKKKILPKNPSE